MSCMHISLHVTHKGYLSFGFIIAIVVHISDVAQSSRLDFCVKRICYVESCLTKKSFYICKSRANKYIADSKNLVRWKLNISSKLAFVKHQAFHHSGTFLHRFFFYFFHDIHRLNSTTERSNRNYILHIF